MPYLVAKVENDFLCISCKTSLSGPTVFSMIYCTKPILDGRNTKTVSFSVLLYVVQSLEFLGLTNTGIFEGCTCFSQCCIICSFTFRVDLFRRWHFDTKDQVKEKCLAVFPLTFLRVQVAVDRQCLKILGVFDQTHLAV